MKKIFIVTCMLTFAFMISAQGGQGRGFQQTPEQRAAYFADMKKEVNLTDKQLTDIKKIDEDYRAKMQTARENAGGDREKMRETMTKLRTEQTAKIKPLLSAEQFKKYEAFQAQRMQRRSNN